MTRDPGARGRVPEWPLRFLRNRFSPQRTLGLHLTIGLAVIITGAWCFSEIAEEIGPGSEWHAFDQQVTVWFEQHAHPALTTAAHALSFCGSVAFLTAVSIAFGIYFFTRGAWNRLLELAVTMLGGSLLNIVLKHFFERQRPAFENPIVTLTSYGFPSGHTMGSTLLYGLLALIAARFIRSALGRAAVFSLAITAISLIGLTRIYLGAHYLTDVAAAIAAGAAWLAVCWTTAETFRKRQQARADRASPSPVAPAN
jgi:undecaprenyl-diphosphatase